MRLCIKYKYQKLLKDQERDILTQLFLDVPSGTAYEEQLYEKLVSQYIKDSEILQMMTILHHRKTSRLMHSLHVSYLCFLQAYRKKWDYESAAIGGLFHDFVLFKKGEYDKTKFKDIWCLYHPQEALKATTEKYNISKVAQDLISKHMFPMALSTPKYKETYLIIYWDKYCAIRELLHKGSPQLKVA